MVLENLHVFSAINRTLFENTEHSQMHLNETLSNMNNLQKKNRSDKSPLTNPLNCYYTSNQHILCQWEPPSDCVPELAVTSVDDPAIRINCLSRPQKHTHTRTLMHAFSHDQKRLASTARTALAHRPKKGLCLCVSVRALHKCQFNWIPEPSWTSCPMYLNRGKNSTHMPCALFPPLRHSSVLRVCVLRKLGSACKCYRIRCRCLCRRRRGCCCSRGCKTPNRRSLSPGTRCACMHAHFQHRKIIIKKTHTHYRAQTTSTTTTPRPACIHTHTRAHATYVHSEAHRKPK